MLNRYDTIQYKNYKIYVILMIDLLKKKIELKHKYGFKKV